MILCNRLHTLPPTYVTGRDSLLDDIILCLHSFQIHLEHFEPAPSASAHSNREIRGQKTSNRDELAFVCFHPRNYEHYWQYSNRELHKLDIPWDDLAVRSCIVDIPRAHRHHARHRNRLCKCLVHCRFRGVRRLPCRSCKATYHSSTYGRGIES